MNITVGSTTRTEEELDAYPPGTQLVSTQFPPQARDNIMTKRAWGRAGAWFNAAGTEVPNPDAFAYAAQNYQVHAAPILPGDRIASTDDFVRLPVGSVIHYTRSDISVYRRKAALDQWVDIDEDIAPVPDRDLASNGHRLASLPLPDRMVVGYGLVSLDEFELLPIGATVQATDETGVYTKVQRSVWTDPRGDEYAENDFALEGHNSIASLPFIDTPAPEPTPEVTPAQVRSLAELEALPIGTRLAQGPSADRPLNQWVRSERGWDLAGHHGFVGSRSLRGPAEAGNIWLLEQPQQESTFPQYRRRDGDELILLRPWGERVAMLRRRAGVNHGLWTASAANSGNIGEPAEPLTNVNRQVWNAVQGIYNNQYGALPGDQSARVTELEEQIARMQGDKDTLHTEVTAWLRSDGANDTDALMAAFSNFGMEFTEDDEVTARVTGRTLVPGGILRDALSAGDETIVQAAEVSWTRTIMFGAELPAGTCAADTVTLDRIVDELNRLGVRWVAGSLAFTVHCNNHALPF